MSGHGAPHVGPKPPWHKRFGEWVRISLFGFKTAQKWVFPLEPLVHRIEHRWKHKDFERLEEWHRRNLEHPLNYAGVRAMTDKCIIGLSGIGKGVADDITFEVARVKAAEQRELGELAFQRARYEEYAKDIGKKETAEKYGFAGRKLASPGDMLKVIRILEERQKLFADIRSFLEMERNGNAKGLEQLQSRAANLEKEIKGNLGLIQIVEEEGRLMRKFIEDKGKSLRRTA